MNKKTTGVSSKADPEYTVDPLEETELERLFIDTGLSFGPDDELFEVSFPETGVVKPETVLDDIELLLHSALLVYAFDKDAERLRYTLRILASSAALLPADALRPELRRTSPRIDALLAFTGVWQPPVWPEMIDCTPLNLDEKECCGMSGIGSGDAPDRSVPYLAFLLAGTDFPFTGEELSDIRSGAGTSVGELRGNGRGKEGGEQ